MKNLLVFVFVLSFLLPCRVIAQMPPTPHASAEVLEQRRLRADYKELRKQIVALKEFSDEKKKIPKLQKDAKQPVKVLATVDSNDGGDEIKTITGYITQQIGDNSVNAYEINFDRATKKITAVKKTGDATEPEVAEAKEKPTVKPGQKKPTTAAKKKKTEDGDEEEEEADEPEEKPAKNTKKEDAE